MTATAFARHGNGREAAYRVFSETDGPTIVVLPAGTMPIEVLDEDPMFDRFLRTLGQYGRVVAIDRPGIGASDALDPGTDYNDQVVEASIAVLDDLRVEQAWFVSGGVGAVAIVRANADRPDRFAGGILVNPARVAEDPTRIDRVLDRDDEVFEDVMRTLAPSRWPDPAYRAWYERAGRLGASATAARAFYAALRSSGERLAAAPDRIEVARPVLLVHRRDNLRTSADDVAWWAEFFPDGEILTVEGIDTPIEAPDSGVIADTIGAFITGSRRDAIDDRPLRAVLFVDLVASTERVVEAGDSSWRAMLDRFEQSVGSVVTRHGGDVVKHTGDGALATFTTGSRALSASVALRRAAQELGLDCRIGVHVGEVELRGDDVGGVAVHIAARVMDRARAGQILASATVEGTTVGAARELRPLGPAELKGVDRPWNLFEYQLGSDPG